jgi:hypothetical protein
LHSGQIHWREISEEEFDKIEAEWEDEIEKGNIQEPTCCHQSDYGKKRLKHRSCSIVESSDEN